MQKAQQLKKCV